MQPLFQAMVLALSGVEERIVIALTVHAMMCFAGNPRAVVVEPVVASCGDEAVMLL